MDKTSIEDIPKELDGKELLANIFINTIISAGNPFYSEVDVPEEIFQTLKEATEKSFGPYGPSEWLCISLETGEVGRAYDDSGCLKIRTRSVTDHDVAEVVTDRALKRIKDAEAD